MQRPRLILMDEPSIGLSPLIVQQLPAMISRVRERTGASVLLVEQDAGLALSLASRVYVLERGAITHTGAAAQFVDSELLVEAYLGRGAAAPPA
jgi:branched-chain amino acid transport system ATP-binding protein